MNILETWFNSFTAQPAPEKVGWVFVCIVMMLTLSPEIKFIFVKSFPALNLLLTDYSEIR